jgi:hypothetical protein
MHLTRVVRVALLAALACVAVLALYGCAGKTCPSGSPVTKDAPEKVAGHMLEYRMSKGAPVSYRFINSSMQTIEIGERSIPIESTETLSFTVTPAGMKDGDNAIGVTIDGLEVEASTIDGSIEADTEHLAGKSFDMTLSKVGVEGGLPETDELDYSIGPEGPKSILTGFGAMFPDLPDGPIEIGDTWPSVLEMNEKTDSNDVTITINAVNTLVGFETYMGLPCAKISSVLTGTMEGSGTEQGAQWTLTSDIDGTGTWYFAHKKGILVSDVTAGTAAGAIVVDAPDGQMTMPVTREYEMMTELVQ